MKTGTFKKSLFVCCCFMYCVMAIAQTADLIPYRKGSKWGYANASKQVVVPATYDEVTVFSEGMGAVKLASKWGFVNQAGKEIIQPKFASATPFKNGRSIVNTSEYTPRYGCIDKTGAVVVEPKFYSLFPLSNGMFKAQTFISNTNAVGENRYLYGILDQSGKEIVPPKYVRINNSFTEGLIEVQFRDPYERTGGKIGFIDSTGKEIIPVKYLEVKEFSEGMVAVKSKSTRYYDVGKWDYFNKNGKQVTNYELDVAEPFILGTAWVKEINKPDMVEIDKEGVIKKSGRMQASKSNFQNGYSIFDKISNAESLAGMDLFERMGMEKYVYGLQDLSGKTILPPVYKRMLFANEEMVIAKQDAKWFCYDLKGNPFTATKYDSMAAVSNVLAAVKKGDRWGCIDRTGKENVKPVYDSIGKFENKIAVVKKNNLYGYLNEDGKEITPPVYQNAFSFVQDMGCVQKNGKIGFVDKTGKEVIPAKYDVLTFGFFLKNSDPTPYSFSFLPAGISRVMLNGRWGYIDTKGNEYWED